MEKNFKGKSRGKRKPFPKREVKGAADDRKFDKTAKDNDPNWYLVNGQLAKDVANFSYNFATGERIHMDPDITSGSGLASTNIRFPGVCAVLTGPSIGISNSLTSPVNVCARDVYSFVRHANSGHANYDTPDLMIYLLAADSVQTFWSYMVRAYGVARIYSQTNRYIGDALLSAMGLNPTSVRENLPNFRAYINQFAIKASVLAVPNTMTYFLRHQWMYQNVYMDEDNSKAQFYMYVPAYVYKYNVNSETSAGELVPMNVASTFQPNGTIGTLTGLGIPALMSAGNDLLNAMLSQEDVGIMSGDILKAYGSEKLYRYAQIPEDYAIAPVYSEEVLAQFHNTDFTGRYIAHSDVFDDQAIALVDAANALKIVQNAGSVGDDGLYCNPYIINTVANAYPKFLDFWTQEVTPEMSLVASRNKLHATLINYKVKLLNGTALQPDSVKALAIDSCGSEICIDAVIYYYDSLTNVLMSVSVSPTTITGTVYNSGAIPYTSKFNQFPLLGGTSGGYLVLPVGSMSNYTVISGAELSAMHNAALLSLFGVPYRW